MNVPKLRFKEFSEEWELNKLKDICLKIKDGTHFSPKTFENGEYKYLTSKNIKNGYLDFSNLEYVNKEDHQKIYSSCDVKKGDVLLTKDGTIGQCCVNELNEEFSLLSSVAFLRVKNQFNNYFLYHILVSDIGQNEINKVIAGQALKRITLTKINDFKFNYPSLGEQTKIASFLNAIDEKIAQLTQKHALLNQYKKGMMQQIFSQQLRFKDENGKEFAEWRSTTLESICQHFQSGKSITSKDIFNDELYPVYGGNGLRGYTKSFTHDGIYALVGRQGALCGNVNLVKGKNYISEHAIAIQANQNNSTEWLAIWLDYMNLGRFSESSAQAGLAVNKLQKFRIEVPSLPEQTKIANFLSRIDQKIEQVAAQLDATKQYKRGLLQQMFV